MRAMPRQLRRSRARAVLARRPPLPWPANHFGARLPKSIYLEELDRLQFELVRLQYWVRERGERVVVLFEGRDAAGKGGTIKRIAEPLNPRGVRLVALGKPSDVERTQW